MVLDEKEAHTKKRKHLNKTVSYSSSMKSITFKVEDKFWKEIKRAVKCDRVTTTDFIRLVVGKELIRRMNHIKRIEKMAFEEGYLEHVGDDRFKITKKGHKAAELFRKEHSIKPKS